MAIERYGFALAYAEESEVERATGYRLVRSRKHIKRAVQIHRASIYHSNAGESERDTKLIGRPWYLHKTEGLTRQGDHVNPDEEKRLQSCLADAGALAAIDAAAEAWKCAVYGAWA